MKKLLLVVVVILLAVLALRMLLPKVFGALHVRGKKSRAAFKDKLQKLDAVIASKIE